MATAVAGAFNRGLRVEGLPDSAQVAPVIDRQKANQFGVLLGKAAERIVTPNGLPRKFPRPWR